MASSKNRSAGRGGVGSRLIKLVGPLKAEETHKATATLDVDSSTCAHEHKHARAHTVSISHFTALAVMTYYQNIAQDKHGRVLSRMLQRKSSTSLPWENTGEMCIDIIYIIRFCLSILICEGQMHHGMFYYSYCVSAISATVL